jgi:hypothetical protein
MSAERPVPPARSATQVRLAAVVLVAIVAIPVAFLLGRSTRTRLVVEGAAPSGGQRAFVLEGACSGGPCQTLWVGPSRESSTKVATLRDSESCDEIAWSRDGSRVAFLIGGYQLRLYDSSSLAPAGQLSLIQPEGTPTARIARGVTFSENGRAVTFDDCPRAHSGCRSGLTGLPVTGEKKQEVGSGKQESEVRK